MDTPKPYKIPPAQPADTEKQEGNEARSQDVQTPSTLLACHCLTIAPFMAVIAIFEQKYLC